MHGQLSRVPVAQASKDENSSRRQHNGPESNKELLLPPRNNNCEMVSFKGGMFTSDELESIKWQTDVDNKLERIHCLGSDGFVLSAIDSDWMSLNKK